MISRKKKQLLIIQQTHTFIKSDIFNSFWLYLLSLICKSKTVASISTIKYVLNIFSSIFDQVYSFFVYNLLTKLLTKKYYSLRRKKNNNNVVLMGH